jgi:tubulin polyglutamylase TTLL4
MLDIHSKSQERRTCGFELYGFDILVDDTLRPWLMEVNVCPSLSSSSPMDRRIKHMLLVDVLNLIGVEYFQKKRYAELKKREKEWLFVNRSDKKTFSKNINSLEELNYRNCIELLSPEDWQVLFECREEEHRYGHFERIFPLKSNVDRLLPLFEIPRYNNLMVAKWLKSERDFLDLIY